MNSFFEKEYALRTNDFGSSNRILPSAILDLFQSVAGEHAAHLGVGYEKMTEKNLIWVMTKVKFEILSSPKKLTKVKVKTWPLKNGRVTFQREYLIFDEAGNILIKGSSEWVTIDTEKRKITAPGKLYNLCDDEFIEDKNFEGKFLKVPAFVSENEGVYISPRFTDFDVNGHVNNTRYADFILNAYPLLKDKEISFLQIDYHLEIKDADSILINYKNFENEVLFSGISKDNQLNFSSKIKWAASL